ncbi:MAG: hypothetical protein ACOX5T_02555 [Candidatus Cryptobacteroides sp.]|jgi:hypothetical protein
MITSVTNKGRTISREFLYKIMWRAHYYRKERTQSYIHERFIDFECVADRKERHELTKAELEQMRLEGVLLLLPVRLSIITDEETAKVVHSGRGARKKYAQLKSRFTKIEESPYKLFKPFKVCTSIWRVGGFQRYYWGTIGVTPSEGHPPVDNGDLIIFITADWRDLQVFIFRGLAKPNDMANLQDVVDYLDRTLPI